MMSKTILPSLSLSLSLSHHAPLSIDEGQPMVIITSLPGKDLGTKEEIA